MSELLKKVLYVVVATVITELAKALTAQAKKA